MQGSWNDDNVKTLKVVVESSRGMDGKPGPSIKGSPQYYHIRGYWHQWHLKTMRKYQRTIRMSFANP
jgi:hypothetical protein